MPEQEEDEIGKMGADKSEKYGIQHRRVSAMTGAGISELFDELAGRMVKQYGGAVESNALELGAKPSFMKR